MRLIIANHHPIVLRGLVNLLGSTSDFSVVATCSSGSDCVKVIRKLRPELALLDLSMPGLNGFEILNLVRSEHIRTRIILLCASPEDSDLDHAVAQGAHGILFKNSTPDLLLQGIREVAFGRKWPPVALI